MLVLVSEVFLHVIVIPVILLFFSIDKIVILFISMVLTLVFVSGE